VTTPTGLHALSLSLGPGPAIDPFRLAGPDGMVFRSGTRTRVGLGSALVIHLPDGLDSVDRVAGATGALASISVDDRTDPTGARAAANRVVAFGALPFDRSAPATLVVPELVYGSDGDGPEWITVIGTEPPTAPSDPAGLRSWLLGRQRPAGLAPAGPDTSAGPSPLVAPRSTDDDFVAMVTEALGAIGRGEVAKVVVSRRVDVTMGDEIAVDELLERWQRLEPNCTVFSLPTPEGQFVGASPELLIERSGSRIHSRPLAGTSGRSGPGQGRDRRGGLLDSSKDADEHRFVVEAIEEVLRPLCADLEVPRRPGLVHLHTVTHLGTPITGTLAVRPDGTVPSALELLAAIHPTPAVGGVPGAAARRLIARLEPEPRGFYAGAVGVLDAAGDGEWMLGIRSMTVRGRSATLAAGLGVVAGSDPASELQEAHLKLMAVFGALAPGRTLSTSARPAPGDTASSDEHAGEDDADVFDRSDRHRAVS
jgi:isochorismate synthase